jgi:hypothetical protein
LKGTVIAKEKTDTREAPAELLSDDLLLHTKRTHIHEEQNPYPVDDRDPRSGSAALDGRGMPGNPLNPSCKIVRAWPSYRYTSHTCVKMVTDYNDIVLTYSSKRNGEMTSNA